MNISLVVKEEKEELGGIIVPYPPTRISLVSISANGKSIVFHPISNTRVTEGAFMQSFSSSYSQN